MSDMSNNELYATMLRFAGSVADLAKAQGNEDLANALYGAIQAERDRLLEQARARHLIGMAQPLNEEFDLESLGLEMAVIQILEGSDDGIA